MAHKYDTNVKETRHVRSMGRKRRILASSTHCLVLPKARETSRAWRTNVKTTNTITTTRVKPPPGWACEGCPVSIGTSLWRWPATWGLHVNLLPRKLSYQTHFSIAKQQISQSKWPAIALIGEILNDYILVVVWLVVCLYAETMDIQISRLCSLGLFQSAELSQYFLMTFSWHSQDLLRTFSGVSHDIHSDFFRNFWGISQDFVRTFSGLLQNFSEFLLWHPEFSTDSLGLLCLLTDPV